MTKMSVCQRLVLFGTSSITYRDCLSSGNSIVRFAGVNDMVGRVDPVQLFLLSRVA